MAKMTKVLNSLFISKVRIKALKYFLFNLDAPLHLRGVVRQLKEEINAVRRELARLDEIGFLKCEARGNRKYYSVNMDFMILDELLGIFHKSFGLGGVIVSNASKLGDVKFAILTGSFLRGSSQEQGQKVDMVLIGEVKLPELEDIVKHAEKKLGREIHYSVLKENEFNLRKKRKDAFVLDLLLNDKLVLIGGSNEFAS